MFRCLFVCAYTGIWLVLCACAGWVYACFPLASSRAVSHVLVRVRKCAARTSYVPRECGANSLLQKQPASLPSLDSPELNLVSLHTRRAGTMPLKWCGGRPCARAKPPSASGARPESSSSTSSFSPTGPQRIANARDGKG